LGTQRALFSASDPGNESDANFFKIDFSTGNLLQVSNYNGDLRQTTQVFRDVGAWYHIVVALDTTQATANDRIKVYVNGGQITAFNTTTNPSQNADLGINATNAHNIGRVNFGGGFYLNGYLTEINFIDGSALTPTSFGEFNSDTGVWQPKAYTGSYGTNGFYLNFSDNASTTTLGDDLSGNGNDWTTNNFSVTAGVGNDSLVDSPTRYGTDTGAGGEVRGNYGTMNPLDQASIVTVSNGNLDVKSNTSGSWGHARGTFGFPSTGKWYWEVTLLQPSTEDLFSGIGAQTSSLSTNFAPGSYANMYGMLDNGDLYANNSSSAGYGSSFGDGDVIIIAFDRDNSKIYFGKNGSWFNSGNPATQTNPAASSISTTLQFFPMTGSAGFNPPSGQHNFGQRPFAYTAPSGFKALVTTNLPAPTIEDGGEYFNTILYTGTGSSNARTGVGFQPDWVWIKERNAAADHGLYDAVRGVQNQLESNTTTAETAEATGLTAFGTDGFTVGALAQLNTSGDTYVAWNWKANGAGVSNTDGTITSTVSVNTTSGFSIVTYTGNGSNGASVGHGLGVKPVFWILKQRSGTQNWLVSHQNLSAADNYLILDSTSAQLSNASNIWTADSSKITFTTSYAGTNNNTSTYVIYAFAPVAGYSAFGSYTGNGSADGPFVYTGFRPAFVMTKKSSGVSNWNMIDDRRPGEYNPADNALLANSSLAETIISGNPVDLLSSGFKIRNTEGGFNESAATYIYMAFAENPFSIALAR
jgi:hypothetical protein